MRVDRCCGARVTAGTGVESREKERGVAAEARGEWKEDEEVARTGGRIHRRSTSHDEKHHGPRDELSVSVLSERTRVAIVQKPQHTHARLSCVHRFPRARARSLTVVPSLHEWQWPLDGWQGSPTAEATETRNMSRVAPPIIFLTRLSTPLPDATAVGQCAKQDSSAAAAIRHYLEWYS